MLGGNPVFFGRAGQLICVGGQFVELIKGGVMEDWCVLLRCICGFLSYICAVKWVIHVFHDEGGQLGWHWYSRLLYAVQILVWFVVYL